MEVSVLGAAREVGRAAFLVNAGGTQVLLDYGAQTGREPTFPIHVQPRSVAAILLTHAHLDHSGGTPLFYVGDGGSPLYATPPTIESSDLLIQDFLKISGFYLPFEYLDLLALLRQSRRVGYQQTFDLGGLQATFRDAGHIPGSATILLEHDGRRLLYTGDLNMRSSQLLHGADIDFGPLDLVITESTYALTPHPPRQQVEAEFVMFCKDVVERGGTLLVPAFSVGRAQEIACVLRAASFPYPVAMDGMALKTNEILLRNQEYLRDPEHFRRSLAALEIIGGWSQRKRLAKTPGVIISPAGMLVGGASVFYTNEVSQNKRNAIAIVSFQVPGTPGRSLLEKGVTMVNGRPRKVKAEIRRFDFSSHGGRDELFQFFDQIKGRPQVLTVHGEEESCTGFAVELRERYGFQAEAPRLGDKIAV